MKKLLKVLKFIFMVSLMFHYPAKVQLSDDGPYGIGADYVVTVVENKEGISPEIVKGMLLLVIFFLLISILKYYFTTKILFIIRGMLLKGISHCTINLVVPL